MLAEMTALHGAFNIKDLDLQTALIGRIDAKGLFATLTNMWRGYMWRGSKSRRIAMTITGGCR
jgi:hypothetical protein